MALFKKGCKDDWWRVEEHVWETEITLWKGKFRFLIVVTSYLELIWFLKIEFFFLQRAQKNREEYMKEMEVYKKKKEEESASLRKDEEELMKLQKQEAMQLLKKKEKTETLIKKTKEKRQKQKGEKITDPNKPKKPASSFFLFSKEARKNLVEERPGMNHSTLTALISVKWKELSEEEKQKWNSKAAEAMDAYKKELEAYNNNKLAAEEEA